jgi:hypothetical protein
VEAEPRALDLLRVRVIGVGGVEFLRFFLFSFLVFFPLPERLGFFRKVSLVLGQKIVV